MNFGRFWTLLVLLLLPMAASAQTFNSNPFLSVQGHAEAKVKPDVFPVRMTLTDLGMDAAKSQKIVEGLAATVLDAAKSQGVADPDVEVGNLEISPETQWDDDKEIEIFKGNNYERIINLRFRSLESLRRFIDAMPMSRNLRIDTQTFEYSGADELKRKLRREAIADARKGAEDMASAVGKRLLEIFNVSDRAQSTIYAASGYSRDGAVALLAPGALGTVTVTGAVKGSAIVLREGEITVSADAFLVYLIGD